VLKEEGLGQFRVTRKVFNDRGYTDEEIDKYFLCKGVCPYSYLTDASKLRETELPPRKYWRNDLRNEEDVTDDHWTYIQEIWALVKRKAEVRGERFTVGTFVKEYNLGDATQVADVFEKNRTTSFALYNIDPAHFISGSSFARHALLKRSGVKLGLYRNQDQDLALLMRRNQRGGMVQLGVKQSDANNKYVPGYTKDAPNRFILYIDADSLYPTGMRGLMPHTVPVLVYKKGGEGHAWLDDLSPTVKIMSLPKAGEKGWDVLWDASFTVLREDGSVDEKATHALHDKFAELSPLFTRATLNDEDLSPATRKAREALGLKSVRGEERLVGDLKDKKKVLSDYRVVQWLLAEGVQMTELHEVYEFDQADWMRGYIEECVAGRNEATSTLMKDSWKLRMNGVFGGIPRLTRMVSRFDYASTKELAKDKLWAVQRRKVTACLNQPSYVGFTILELSKLQQMRTFYGLKARWEGMGCRVRLCYTDTDSLVMELETEDHSFDVYEDMRVVNAECVVKGVTPMFNMSAFKKKDSALHKFYDPSFPATLLESNKDDVGYPIKQWVGVGPKMYSVSYSKLGADGEPEVLDVKQKGKGHPSFTLPGHDVFREINVSGERAPTYKVTRMVSKDHTMRTIEQTRKGLCPMDVKRWWREDGTSLPIGHYAAVA